MDKLNNVQVDNRVEKVDADVKKPFAEPKLTWIEPELVPHGTVETVAGFFGTFSP